jgi:hypothetical protein
MPDACARRARGLHREGAGVENRYPIVGAVADEDAVARVDDVLFIDLDGAIQIGDGCRVIAPIQPDEGAVVVAFSSEVSFLAIPNSACRKPSENGSLNLKFFGLCGRNKARRQKTTAGASRPRWNHL